MQRLERRISPTQRTSPAQFVLDDRRSGTLAANSGNEWRLFTDKVMGGVSSGRLQPASRQGKACLHLAGEVSLDNNGGFVQASLDLDEQAVTAAAHSNGVLLDVCGDGEIYNVHLRTLDTRRPWQSYRASFTATPEWRTVHLPFAGFAPYRIDSPLALDRLRRLGIVAIGRAFQPDLWLGQVAFYR